MRVDKIKIVFVYAALGGGGAQRQFTLLINNLNRDIFEPKVIAIGQNKIDCINHITKYPTLETLDEVGSKEEFNKFLSYRKLKDNCEINFFERKDIIKTQSALYNHLKKEEVKYVFSISPIASIYASLSASFIKDVKVIHGVRGNGSLLNYKFNLFNLYHYFSQIFVDYFIYNSNSLKSNAIKCGYTKKKSKVIYNGIPAYFDKDNFKKNNKVEIAMIARFVPLKNHIFFFKALQKLKVKNDFKVCLYGDGDLEETLKDDIVKRGLKDIVFFKGWVSDVSEVLKKTDIVCLTSSFEGFNNSISEAQMHGIPVLSTNSSGSNEIVINGETGFITAIDDIETFIEKLEKLIDDSILREQLALKAYRRSRKLFSVENMVQEYEKFFQVNI